MGHGEQIRAAIELALRNDREQRKPTEGSRAAKKQTPKPPELDRQEGSGEERSLGVPLGRLMPALIEQGVELLREGGGEEHLAQVGAILRGLERFDVTDTQWDGTVSWLFLSTVESLLRCPALPARDPAAVQLTEAVVAGVALEMKARLAGEQPLSLNQRTEGQLCQALSVLLQQSGRALHEQLSLRAAPQTPEWAQQLSASVCGFCLEQRDSALGAVLGFSPMLDRLVAGLWQVLADFPRAFEDPVMAGWWRDVLAELARPRRDESSYDADLIAEAVVLVVERGAVDFTSLVRNPSNKQLFLTSAMRGVLEVLTDTIGEEPKYRLVERLGRTELYVVMQAVICAWIERPEWLFRKPAQQEKAATLLPVCIEALAQLDEGSLKALLRRQRLQHVLVSTLLSGLSSKLSSLSGQRVASVLAPVLAELTALGLAGWSVLLDQDRLMDLLTAISRSKIEDKLFGEDLEDTRAAARSIALVAHEMRTGRILPLTELVERLNKGK